MKKTKTVTTTTTVTTKAPRKTLVSFLLDRSGSMSQILEETLSGFNSYLDRLQSEAGDLVEFTLVQFDSEATDTVYAGAKLKDVARLTPQNFHPRGFTPLCDAAVELIKTTKALVEAREAESPRVVFVILTDGMENASHKYTPTDLSERIQKKIKAGWQFVYMGANIDAYRDAKRFGIERGSTVSYITQNSVEAFGATARNTVMFASGARSGTQYDDSQKLAAGDKFANGDKLANGDKPVKKPRRRNPAWDVPRSLA